MSILQQYIRLVEEETIQVPNLQQKTQRAKEIAVKMGIDPNNMNIVTNGGVPTSINGKPVPPELHTEREKKLISAAQSMRQGMGSNQTPGIVPPESPIAQQNKPNPQEQTPMGRNDKVAALQKDLLAAGADLGPFENNGVDGLMGKYTRAAMAQFPDIVAKHPEAAKMPDAPPGSGSSIKGGQKTKPTSPETDTTGETVPKPENTKPQNPNSIRPEVKAMADLLDQLVQQAQLKESLNNDPKEQIKKYRSIVINNDESINEYASSPWIGGSSVPSSTPKTTPTPTNTAPKTKSTVMQKVKTASNVGKRALPLLGAGMGLWGAGSQLSQVKNDLEQGDLGSAALGTLSGLAHALSIPLAFATSMMGAAGGIGAAVAGSALGSAADARRAGRGSRKVIEVVDQIQAKLNDPNNGFTQAESKLLSDKVAQVKAQLLRNNIAIEI